MNKRYCNAGRYRVDRLRCGIPQPFVMQNKCSVSVSRSSILPLWHAPARTHVNTRSQTPYWIINFKSGIYNINLCTSNAIYLRVCVHSLLVIHDYLHLCAVGECRSDRITRIWTEHKEDSLWQEATPAGRNPHTGITIQ